ncbi:MAG: peptide MFS transporter [Pirellulales bacterium]|nr:peptide MFS transporter [Pirellulales bacterium]
MSDPRSELTLADDQPTVLGHPTGLYTLFFAEMWERFSYYGMRALLVFYMLKGFLGYDDTKAYAIYGAYGALVYMTPFFGGMLADRLLGARRAVVFGGLLMAAGQACLMVPSELAFFAGLALLIVGNGFFKPNISNIVGTLYTKTPEKRDGGFTIFYMGINLGAAMSPLLCGYIGETYDWKYGFLLATIGMLTGLAVFVAPRIVTATVIVSGAVAAAIGLIIFHPIEIISTGVNIFVAIALVVAASIAAIALSRGGLPVDAGAPPDPHRLRKRLAGVLPAEWAVYLGTILVVPLFMIFVSGGALVQSEDKPITLVQKQTIKDLKASKSALDQIGGVCLEQVSQPVGVVLTVCFLLAFGYLIFETFRLPTIPRHHMYVVLILMFFCMMFWAFFEQAGSSINNFTDRNVDRVFNAEITITEADVGKTIRIEPTQEQLGYYNGAKLFTLTDLDKLRTERKKEKEKLRSLKNELRDLASENLEKYELALQDYFSLKEQLAVTSIPWTVVPQNLKIDGMKVAREIDEIPASLFQSVNPIYILIFGLLFTALWGFLGKRGLEPSTPTKFALGLLQLGLGFGVLWLGTQSADERGMVAIYWLLLCYLLHTTGELCLSPVGLSMISKLSPARLVSTVMGAWFLVTGISMFLAGLIAQFTGVESEGGEKEQLIPAPNLTVDTYGKVYGIIAIAAVAFALICFCLVPLLKKWMHEGEE